MSYRELLKKATGLKKEKRYDEACQVLRVAYQSADVGEVILIGERLRLPVYLFLAGRKDEAWQDLNFLSSQHAEFCYQIPIRTQMRIFSEKEGRWNDAIFYAAWVWVLSVKDMIFFVKVVHDRADEEAESSSAWGDHKPLAYTEKGSPIYDVAHNHMLKSLNDHLDIDRIDNEFYWLCQKIGKPDLSELIADKLLEIIEAEDESGEWVGELHSFFRRML